MRFFVLVVLSWSLISNSCFSEETVEKTCLPKQRYTVIKSVAEGAFGQIYLVENESGIKFALKCFKDYCSEGADTPSHLATTEFEYGQLLNHPNIVKTYDLVAHDSMEHQEHPCLILEFVNGKDLTEKFDEKISFNKALEIALQLVDALRHALSFNLFFIDFNEGNIMLDEEGNLKLVDLSGFSPQPEAYCPYYFDVITEKCLLLLRKADLNREEKFNLFFKVKQIAWDYHEDTKEGKSVSLDDYFNKLTHVLNSPLGLSKEAS